MILIRIFTGESIEDKCRNQLHPINEVKKAKEIFDLNKDIDLYSNSPHFVKTLHDLVRNSINSITLHFYLNNMRCSLEDVFEDFNKSYTLLSEIIGE